MDDRIRVSLQHGVADVRLVRADKMNALDDAMFEALRQTGERLKTAPGVRAVVLSGEGRAFCAGLDTANFGKMASGERGGARLLQGERTRGGANPPQHTVMVWRELPVPVIAAVHGVAYGGGFQLMLAADIRFMRPTPSCRSWRSTGAWCPTWAAWCCCATWCATTSRASSPTPAASSTAPKRSASAWPPALSADPYADALALAREIAARPPKAMRAAKRLLDLAATATPRRSCWPRAASRRR